MGIVWTVLIEMGIVWTVLIKMRIVWTVLIETLDRVSMCCALCHSLNLIEGR